MGDKIKASYKVGEILQKDGEWVKVASVTNHPEYGRRYTFEAPTEDELKNHPPKKRQDKIDAIIASNPHLQELRDSLKEK